MFDPDPFVDRIYEAAVVPEMWPEVLEAIAVPAQSVGAVLFSANSNYEGWTASPGFAEIFRNFIADGWAARNPRPARGLARNIRGFFTDHDLFTQDEIDSDPTYSYFRSVGGGLFAGLAAPMPAGDVVAFSWERNHLLGRFDAATIEVFNRLAGHLQRAALIAGRLGLEKARMAAETMRALGLPA
ncbi:MAG TPA: hypothetical protein VMU18_04720, partial [Rhodoblastus sp.]|nr:hypothetical protein [Rhodoblastus sp.]